MAIKFTSGESADTLEKLHALKWGDELDRLSVRSFAEEAPVTLTGSYQVDYLSVAAVAQGNLADAVQTRGQRDMLMQGGRPVAEVELDGGGDPVALHEGPGKDGLQTALEQAQSIPGDFDARVVQSAPLKFSALLLEGEGKQMLIPYPPNLTPLPNGEPISVEDALKVLQPIAAQIIEMTKDDDKIGG